VINYFQNKKKSRLYDLVVFSDANGLITHLVKNAQYWYRIFCSLKKMKLEYSVTEIHKDITSVADFWPSFSG
jgi:hypothetical protein